MKDFTKLKLAIVHQICDAEDVSTERMIALMQDICKVDHDCVMKYLTDDKIEKENLFVQVNELSRVFIEASIID